MRGEGRQQPLGRVFPLCLCLFLGLGAAVQGAEEEAAVGEAPPSSNAKPVVTVLGGLGSCYGGFGGQVELSLGSGRFSVFGGLGYYPEDDDDDRYPSGLAGAGGARLYTGGVRHRGFLEAAVAPIASNYWVNPIGELVDQVIAYGPSVQLGYLYVRESGFTFQVTLGVGYARWSKYDLSVVALQTGLGIGYTWR